MIKKFNDFIEKISGVLRVIEFVFVVLSVVLLVNLFTLIGRTFSDASQKLSQAAMAVSDWIEAQTSTMDYKPEIMLTQLETQAKFVTHTVHYDITIGKSVENRILWDYIPVGSADAKIYFKDNKIQFYIPLSEVKASDIIFDAKNEILTVNIPQAKLDKDIVEIQTATEKVLIEQNKSLVPFLGPDTQPIIEELRAEAKRELILTANKDLELQKKINTEARQLITEFLRKLFADFLSRGHRKLNVVYP